MIPKVSLITVLLFSIFYQNLTAYFDRGKTMPFIIEAACLCNKGKIRKNNEDNFFFDGRCLVADNTGLKHPVSMTRTLRREICVAVFDGMGGENFGEYAAFTAAECMRETAQKLKSYFISERKLLNDICMQINNAVIAKRKEFCTEHMGSTMVALCFSNHYVYACNLGDSRAYRLRNGELLQLSKDHVEKNMTPQGKKAPLTQHLGIDPEEYMIEPHIAKGELKRDDQYLLCSDGLTDMLTNLEIDQIMSEAFSAEECVQNLVDAALEKGGKDNVTAIVCRIH